MNNNNYFLHLKFFSESSFSVFYYERDSEILRYTNQLLICYIFKKHCLLLEDCYYVLVQVRTQKIRQYSVSILAKNIFETFSFQKQGTALQIHCQGYTIHIFSPFQVLHKLSNQDMIHYSISAIFRFLLKPTQIYYCRVFCWQFIKKLFILLYPHFLFGVRKWHQFFRQILLIIFK